MYKYLFDNKKAIIFDFDGTVADTEIYWEEAAKLIFDAVSQELSIPDFPAGLGLVGTWDWVLQKVDSKIQMSIPDLVTATKKKFIELSREADVMEGFWQFVLETKRERGFKLGLVSNTDRDVVSNLMKRLDLVEVFDVVITGDEVERPKPHPEMYKKCLEQLGVKNHEAIAFEDSVIGARASVKAGIQTIIIWNGKTDQDKYPRQAKIFSPDFDVFVGNMDENLEDVIKKLAAEEIS